MKVVYARQDFPPSWQHAIFLAGPTPRDPETPSWRPEALEILEKMEYEGVVFVPEPADGEWASNYTDQADWEEKGLELADRIVFWVPRDLRTMPAFTTNVEFGKYVATGKAVLGRPDGAPKTRYLDWLASKHDTKVVETLHGVCGTAIKGWEDAEGRKDGERWVPDVIFRTPMFQAWYESQQAVGNRLDEARVLWTFRIPGKPELGIFSYVLWVKVWIAAEGRFKENEWVFARTDIACVVLHYNPNAHAVGYEADEWPLGNIIDTEVVLVKEFRSPARTTDGFIHELPGGSTDPSDDNAKESALREVHEETGLLIDPERMTYVGSRQAAGTLSSHHVHCYSVELTEHELAAAKKLADDGETFGETGDSELTYVEVTSVRDMLKGMDADWTTLGLILRAVINPWQ
jgi:8-oxo-dGTP pyrophosphatase MutT (NUDIX family)